MNPQAVQVFETLKPFIGRSQWRALRECLGGEERKHFGDLLKAYAERIQNMPHTYQQDGKGNDAVVTLHYFKNGCDWYITEKDMGCPNDPDDVNNQQQAFGWAILNGDLDCAELGYISIEELVANGVELDLYFTPCTLGEVKAKRGG